MQTFLDLIFIFCSSMERQLEVISFARIWQKYEEKKDVYQYVKESMSMFI